MSVWEAKRLSQGPEVTCSFTCSFIQTPGMSQVEQRRSSLKTLTLLVGFWCSFLLLVPISPSGPLAQTSMSSCPMGGASGGPHWASGADCRSVPFFPRETVLDAATWTGRCGRKHPHPTFPGVMERDHFLLTSWVTPFAWLSLSFLSPDCFLASILAAPCSDSRQWRAGGVPYDPSVFNPN